MTTDGRIPRRLFVAGISLLPVATSARAPSQSKGPEAFTFVLVHGAWHGGWCWRKVATLLRRAGHEVYTPTLTGLGERAHLPTRDIDLATHVSDINAVFFYEDLHNVVLVGHSYGGMVIAGVAPRVVTRLARVIYLDAFMPEDGKSLVEYAKAELPQGISRLPPQPNVPEGWGVTDADDVAWMKARLTDQPIRTATQPVRIDADISDRVPHTYIRSSNNPPMVEAAGRAKQRGFRSRELLAAGHDAMVTRPTEVAQLLSE